MGIVLGSVKMRIDARILQKSDSADKKSYSITIRVPNPLDSLQSFLIHPRGPLVFSTCLPEAEKLEREAWNWSLINPDNWPLYA